MKTLIFLILACPLWTAIDKPKQIDKSSSQGLTVQGLASSNGFKVSARVIAAIVKASNQYSIPITELTAIAIVETGIGQNIKASKNHNGSVDRGLFQINSINRQFCIEYNLESHEGSALCAAKLLDNLRQSRTDYVGAYHSKTPSKKVIYLKKIAKVFKNYADKYYIADNKAD